MFEAIHPRRLIDDDVSRIGESYSLAMACLSIHDLAHSGPTSAFRVQSVSSRMIRTARARSEWVGEKAATVLGIGGH
ncbi:hypothetical protein CBI38_24980 [Rhodococcus oxybenzonivorans]|uniref:Uncharacterized protein n=1 Tax=Rhodococcus oxybenzonivorans TaxID=1990687 RepID=A0A2S2C0A8_9NOCA|nr:hypothetical protein CBI38_24980 [Rhodococcus oxybenzonivorans]